MTPTNTAMTPEIMNIADNQNVKHTVIPTPHTHSQSEIDGLAEALEGKAAVDHSHANIYNGDNNMLSVGEGYIDIELYDGKSGGELNLTVDNLPNLSRALSDPNTVPTANSDKLVTSGGVYSALAGKMDSRQFDSEPTANSDKLITSGDVYSALSGKMDRRQFDSEPTLNSTNLVTSGVVKAALDRKANTVHTHVASQVEGVMPYYVTYDGNSINLDDILTEPHTMQRLIIENAESSSFDIVAGLFTSQTENLVIHINNTPEKFVVDPGDYALVTIFKVDRGETAHGHDVCYFAYVEGIFNYES